MMACLQKDQVDCSGLSLAENKAAFFTFVTLVKLVRMYAATQIIKI